MIIAICRPGGEVQRQPPEARIGPLAGGIHLIEKPTALLAGGLRRVPVRQVQERLLENPAVGSMGRSKSSARARSFHATVDTVRWPRQPKRRDRPSYPQ